MVHVIEFQKRGLPHTHILLTLKEESKLRTEDYDKVVHAELPDPMLQPSLFAKVVSHNIHGPCGELNSNSPCMKDGVCQKKFPKGYIYFLYNLFYNNQIQ